MRNIKKKIKISACESLIRLKGKYLVIAIHCLGEELKKESFDESLVYCLCDYISVINKIISWFTILIEKEEGPEMDINPAQALVAKTYIINFRVLKEILMQNYSIFVEIN